MLANDIVRHHSLISDQIDTKKIKIILNSLEIIIGNGVIGDVVEFGCYVGTTSLFLQRILSRSNTIDNKQLYLYDSFEGLPDKSNQDLSLTGQEFKKGELNCSKKTLKNNFKKANLTLPNIKKAWFNELGSFDIPRKICFGFLDGDFYDSILDSLKIVWPVLSINGQLIIDDYDRDELPGVKKAVTTFLSTIPDRYIFSQSNNLAILSKKN